MCDKGTAFFLFLSFRQVHCDFSSLFASVPMIVCCFGVVRLTVPWPVPEALALVLGWTLDFLANALITYLSLVTIVRCV